MKTANEALKTINEALPIINQLENDQLTRFNVLNEPVMIWRKPERFELDVERITGKYYRVFVASFFDEKTFVLCEPDKPTAFLAREIIQRLRGLVYENTPDVEI